MVGYIKYKKLILTMLAFVIFPLVIKASGDRFVQEVRIEGAISVSAETIKSKLETKPGRITSRDMLNKDIRAVYAMGAFQNVEVDETRGEKGWIYTFHLTEKPVITKVRYVGN